MKEFRLVYSTTGGNRCSSCQKPLRKCRCEPVAPPATASVSRIVISRETKGRKGKGVTLVSGLTLSDGELKQLAKQLKNLCGAGGAIKTGVIEIQGDHRAIIRQTLEKQFPGVKLYAS